MVWVEPNSTVVARCLRAENLGVRVKYPRFFSRPEQTESSPRSVRLSQDTLPQKNSVLIARSVITYPEFFHQLLNAFVAFKVVAAH